MQHPSSTDPAKESNVGHKQTTFTSDEGGRDALRVIQEFMKKNGTEGKVIFAVITGSRAYNAFVETSDYDYKAVYLAPTESWLGMDHPKEPHANKEPDIQIYEAKTFLDHALKGNPFTLELLYSERYYYCTQEWRDLLQLRRLFLTPQAIQAHIEYSKGQLKEHKAKPKEGKRLYHTVRILFAAEDIAAGCDICLWLEGPRRDLVLKIRSEILRSEEVVAMANARIDLLSGLADQAPSREAPRACAEAWLRHARIALLR